MTCRWVIASIALGIAGCGNSDPVISNLLIQPASIPASQVERTLSLSVTFSFSGFEGGVATVHVRSPLLMADQPMANPTGATSGRAEQSLAVTIPTGAGAYSLEIWITDDAGHDSNRLFGNLSVSIGGPGT
jgi:hypothetical protein